MTIGCLPAIGATTYCGYHECGVTTASMTEYRSCEYHHTPHAKAAELRRTLISQIELACQLLGSREKLSDRSIHEIRKTLKQARATLRLLRPSIGDRRYRLTNKALRNAALPLRAARDAKVVLDAFDALASTVPRKMRSSLAAVRRMLKQERHAALRALVHHSTSIASSITALMTISSNARRWPTSNDNWQDVITAFRRTYKKGRSALADSRHRPSDDNLHEWRKQTKYLWHQLQLLRPLDPGHLSKFLHLAQRLAAHLGDDHDLAILRNTLHAGNAALLCVVDKRRATLQQKSFLLGRRLYALTPRHFASRLHGTRRRQ